MWWLVVCFFVLFNYKIEGKNERKEKEIQTMCDSRDC